MKRKYIIGGAIIAVVAGYLLYLTLDSSLSYYVTVSELIDNGPEVYDTNIRVAGKVADSPVDWGAEEIELSFTITEGGETLLVVECAPAAYAAYATNEAEKAADIKVLHVRVAGAYGRSWMSGTEAFALAARKAAVRALEAIEGKEPKK